MSADHQPNPVFGRRGREIRPSSVPAKGAPRPKRALGFVLCLVGLTSLLLATGGALFWTLSNVAALKADMTRAEQRVIEIVNQPVTHLPRSGSVGVFSPGWFHPGAAKPDFNNVDIRATQEFPYDQYEHVTSDLNPDEMFIGSELEFNSMTKYFYTDRTLPKKRLSDSEMIEINNLYRVIGRDDQALSAQWWTTVELVAAVFGLGSALLLILITHSRRAG